MSLVFSSDPRVLPVSYDCPECDAIANATLLECPRNPSPFLGESTVLGRLSTSVPLTNALSFLVGVSCSGTRDYFVSLYAPILDYFKTATNFQSGHDPLHTLLPIGCCDLTAELLVSELFSSKQKLFVITSSYVYMHG